MLLVEGRRDQAMSLQTLDLLRRATRNTHSSNHPQRPLYHHPPKPRERQRRRDPFAGRRRDAEAEIAFAAESETGGAAGVDQADASRWLTKMEKQQIVELLPVTKRTKVYQKTPADFPLRISEQLEAELEYILQFFLA